MTDETSQTINSSTPQTFGNRLKNAREDLRLDLKDVASQLRLRVSIIEMLEKEMYSDDMPITFLRGYLRSYAKFLEIPDTELNSALSVEPFQPKQVFPKNEQAEQESLQKFLNYADKSIGNVLDKKVLSGNTKHIVTHMGGFSKFMKRYYMSLVTCIIIFTLGYLLVTWWNSHKNMELATPMTGSEKTFVADNNEPAAVTENSTVEPVNTPIAAKSIVVNQPKTSTQAALPEPKFETLAEAKNQDDADDEAVVFEDEAPQPSIAAANKNIPAPIKDNKMSNTYNE